MPTLEDLGIGHVRGSMSLSGFFATSGLIEHVQNMTRSDQMLSAEVWDGLVYRVVLRASDKGFSADCTCPSHGTVWCPHVGAVILKFLQSPEAFVPTSAHRDESPKPNAKELQVDPVAPPASQRPEGDPDWIAHSFDERRAAQRDILSDWLREQSMAYLRQMARERGWAVKASRKADLADQLVERMTRPDEVAKSESGMDADTRHVLRALILLGGAASEEPERVLPLAQAIGHVEVSGSLEAYSRRMQGLGLALPGSLLYRYRASGIFVPDAIARGLGPALAQVAVDPSPSAADKVQQSDARDLLRAVTHVLLLLEHSPTPLRPPMPVPRVARECPDLQGWDYVPEEVIKAKEEGRLGYSNLEFTVPPPRHPLPDPVIERLAPIAGGEWRLDFVYELLVATQVLQPGSPVTVWPEVKERFLDLAAAERRALLARTYFLMTNWSVLWQVLREQDSLRLVRQVGYVRAYPLHLTSRLASYRLAVLRVLASLPEGEWVPLRELDEVMRIVWPTFGAQSTSAGWSYGDVLRWHLSDATTNKPIDPANRGHWDMAQGAFIRAMLAGPLHWLGLVDLRWRDGELSAILCHDLADIFWDRCKTPNGAARLGRPREAMPTAPSWSVDGSRIRVEAAALTAQVHGALGMVARLVETNTDQFVYELDPRVAHQAFEAGATLDDLLAGWDAVLPGAMPDELRDRLAAWWQGYGRTRVYTDMALVEFADDYALTEMRAVTSLDQVAIAEITPRAVIVPTEAVDQLVAELEAAGYTPRKTDET